MATKSIFQTVNITTADGCRRLVEALESSANRAPIPEIKRPVKYVTGNEIKEMFCIEKDKDRLV